MAQIGLWDQGFLVSTVLRQGGMGWTGTRKDIHHNSSLNKWHLDAITTDIDSVIIVGFKAYSWAT